MRREAHIDYETFSALDLTKVGAYRYAEDESTEILMCSYYRPEWPVVKIWVPAEGESMPSDLQEIYEDQGTDIIAWNANFERCITRCCLPHFDVPIFRFRCAMVGAMSVGFPGKLAQAGPAIGLSEELFKQEGGSRLINKFCKPRKPSKKNPATRWTPAAAPEDWALFKQYCLQDTRAEAAIWHKLHAWRPPAEEQRLWELDQAMNDRGVQIDVELVNAAHSMGLMHRERLVEKAKALTQLDNPNSVKQLIEWLNSQKDFDPDEENEEVDNLRKKTVEQILGRADLDDVVRQVLELRQQIAKSSLKKYDTIIRAVCADGRIRGTMQFGGANRTMRWAGRLLQVQNLPQGIIEDLELLTVTRELVRAGDYDSLGWIFGEDQIPNVLATLIRTCLIAAPGKRLIVADLSAIEARVTAWFAQCKWRLEVFKTHGMIYEASASQMFDIPLGDIISYKKRTGKHHPIRKKSKAAELALGYQGGPNALVTMGALEQGLTLEELPPIVDAWRTANPEIAGRLNADGYWEGGLWRDVEAAVKKCLRTGLRQEVANCIFRKAGGNLVITLPSGRHMHYVKAHLHREGKRTEIRYWGTDQKTKRWGLLNTYGGKLCIAKDTPVLTRRGWIPIQNVVPFEEVWDGVEWVRQEGAARKGVKETIKAHGVRMTSDHEILTDKGWRRASQSKGLNRASCRLPDGYEVHRIGRQEIDLGSGLRLREGHLVARNGAAKAVEARGDSLVWLHAQSLDQEKADRPRDVGAPGVRGLAEPARPLHSADASGLGELRRPRDSGVQEVEAVLSGVLGGHGSDLRARLDYRSDRQRAGILPGKLPLGDVQTASQQPTQLLACTGTVGADHRSGGCAPARDLSFDFALQSEEVFDLINSGPRHRFVVADENGQPLIVHNCENIVQAFSRDILREILFRLPTYHPIMLVHDEGVWEEAVGEGSLDETLVAMGTEVSFAPGLPLKGAGFENHFYFKD